MVAGGAPLSGDPLAKRIGSAASRLESGRTPILVLWKALIAAWGKNPIHAPGSKQARGVWVGALRCSRRRARSRWRGFRAGDFEARRQEYSERATWYRLAVRCFTR